MNLDLVVVIEFNCHESDSDAASVWLLSAADYEKSDNEGWHRLGSKICGPVASVLADAISSNLVAALAERGIPAKLEVTADD